MKRFLVIASAAFALLTTTTMASAVTRNSNQALGYSVVLVYNEKCEAVSPDFMLVTRFGLNTQVEEDLSPARKFIQDMLDKDGLQVFCDRAKPIVAYGIDQMNKLIEENRKFLKGEDK